VSAIKNVLVVVSMMFLAAAVVLALGHASLSAPLAQQRAATFANATSPLQQPINVLMVPALRVGRRATVRPPAKQTSRCVTVLVATLGRSHNDETGSPDPSQASVQPPVPARMTALLTTVSTNRHKQPVSRATPTPSPSPTPTASPTPQPTLVWSDEFNGPAGSAPNATSWYSDSGKSNSDGAETESPSNVALDGNGHLAITGRYANGAYTSGKIESNRSWEYGTIEASIKIPSGQGLWPAFWGLGTNIGTVGWPACGEIDAMENLGNHTHTVYGSVHGTNLNETTPVTMPEDLSAGFHTYGVTWTATTVTTFVDNTIYAHYSVRFHQPFFWILNLAIGAPGSWPGAPDATTRFPATMLVDWVRVYA
jgi:beta-glucanase (GH16 family)